MPKRIVPLSDIKEKAGSRNGATVICEESSG